MELKVAPSSRLVLDLLDLSKYMWHVPFGKSKKSSFLTYFLRYEYGFRQKAQGSSSLEEKPDNLVFATDDEWMIDENTMELIRIRVHRKTRKVKYDPNNRRTPVPLEFLVTTRKTIMEFAKDRVVVQEDEWRSTDRHTTRTSESWRGRTVFRILPGGIESRTSVSAKSRGSCSFEGWISR